MISEVKQLHAQAQAFGACVAAAAAVCLAAVLTVSCARRTAVRPVCVGTKMGAYAHDSATAYTGITGIACVMCHKKCTALAPFSSSGWMPCSACRHSLAGCCRSRALAQGHLQLLPAHVHTRVHACTATSACAAVEGTQARGCILKPW